MAARRDTDTGASMRRMEDMAVAFVEILTDRMADALDDTSTPPTRDQLADALRAAVQPHTLSTRADPEVDYFRWLHRYDPKRATLLGRSLANVRTQFARHVQEMPKEQRTGDTPQAIIERRSRAWAALRSLGKDTTAAAADEEADTGGVDVRAAVDVMERFRDGILAGLAEAGVQADTAAVTRGLYNVVAPIPAADPGDDPECDHARRVFTQNPERGVELIRILAEQRAEFHAQAERDRALRILVLVHRKGVKVANVVRMLPPLTRQQYERAKQRASAAAMLGQLDDAFTTPGIIDQHDVEWWSAETRTSHGLFIGITAAWKRARTLRRQMIWDLTHETSYLPYAEIARMTGMTDGYVYRVSYLDRRPGDNDDTDD